MGNMETVDLYLHNAEQVATCASRGLKRGPAMAEAGVIERGAVAVKDGRIVATGPTTQLDCTFTAERVIDCTGRSICPGFVDAHTHTVFGGDRAAEFELRIQGASYLEIMAAGGGIVSSVRHTRVGIRGRARALRHGHALTKCWRWAPRPWRSRPVMA